MKNMASVGALLVALSCLLLLPGGCRGGAVPLEQGEDCTSFQGSWVDVVVVECSWELIDEGAWEARVLVDGVFWERIDGLQPIEDAAVAVGADIEEYSGELGDSFQLLLAPSDDQTEVRIDFGCEDRPGGLAIQMDLREPPLSGRGIPTEIIEL